MKTKPSPRKRPWKFTWKKRRSGYYFTFRSGNTKKTLQSQGYTRKIDMLRTIDGIKRNAPSAVVVEEK